MQRQKGRLLKKNKEQSLNYIQVEEFPWSSLKEVDLITADNLRKNILHVKYHSNKELSKKVTRFSNIDKKFSAKTTPLYPVDLTKDYLETQENLNIKKKTKILDSKNDLSLKDLNIFSEKSFTKKIAKDEDTQAAVLENDNIQTSLKELTPKKDLSDLKTSQENSFKDINRNKENVEKKEELDKIKAEDTIKEKKLHEEKKNLTHDVLSKEEDIKSKIKMKNLENKKNFNQNLPLEKKEDSLEKKEDSLEKKEDSLEKKEDSLEKKEDSLEKKEDSLEKNEDIKKNPPAKNESLDVDKEAASKMTLNEKKLQDDNQDIKKVNNIKKEEGNLELSSRAEKPKFDEKYLNKLEDSLTKIEKAHKELNQNAQDVFIEILKISSEKILREQIKLSDDYLKNCFKSLSDEFKKETLQIEISHSDSERFKRVIDESNILKNVKILENPAIEEGDFRIETKNKISVLNLKKIIDTLFNDIKKHLNLEETSKEEK